MWTHTRILWTVLLLGFSLQHPYVAATATMSSQLDSHTTESGKTSTITTITPFVSTQASVISDSSTVRNQLPTSTPLTTIQMMQTTKNTSTSVGQGRTEETTQLKNQEPHTTQQTSSATPNTADSTSPSNTTPIPTTSATYTTQPASIDSISMKTSAEPFVNISMNPTNQSPTPTSQSFSSMNSVLTLNATTTTTTTTTTTAAAATTKTTLISYAANSSEKSEQISTTTMMLETKAKHTTDTNLQTKVPTTQVSSHTVMEGTTTTQSLTPAPVSTVPHTIAKEAAPERFEVHIGGRKNEAIKNMTEYELLVKICKKLSVIMLKYENGNCFLGLTRDNGTLKFTSASVAVNLSYVDEIYSDMIKNETLTNFKHSDDDEIPKTLIAILASCGALVLILFIFAVYCTYHRRSYRKNQQHLTEELQTVENGYHDNPTLEVMEVQPETQEKKLPLNGEFSDSWIVPFDNLTKDDLPDEEDTHL